MIRDEISRLLHWEERHRRLVGRLGLALLLTLAVDAVAGVLTYFLERHAHGTKINTLGDAFFFSTVQLLTVSSQLPNPLTAAGRIVDIGLEVWGVVVVASVGGAFASFFLAGDS